MAVHHTCSYTKNFPHFLFFLSMLVIKKDFIHVILQDETVSLACLIILFITSRCIPKKQKRNTKPRIHIKFKTHRQIYLFFSLSKSKEMQASSYRDNWWSIQRYRLSDLRFSAISDSHRSPFSRSFSLSYRSSCDNGRIYVYISSIHYWINCLWSCKNYAY